MNIKERKRTIFVTSKNLNRHVHSPLVEREREMVTEYPTHIHEITKQRREMTDDIPVIVPLFVYQLSKLHFYKFVMFLDAHLVQGSFRLCYAGF